MIVKEETLKKLRNIFGLNEYEVKAWVSLLSKGVATAGELSEISNVPRSRSYDILESLEKKGFVIMKIGKPIKYLAVKPEEILRRIKKKIEEEAQDRIVSLDKARGTQLFNELELLYTHGIEHLEPSDFTGLLKGKKNVYDHLKTLISNAQKTITIVTTPKEFDRKADYLKAVMKRASDKNVKIRILAPIDSARAKSLMSIAEIRQSDKCNARFVIVDKQHVVFMLADDNQVHEAYDSGVWVNSPFFANALEQMFDLSWENMKEL